MKKIISLIMCLIMIFSVFAFVNVAAEDYIVEGEYEEYPCCVRYTHFRFLEKELNLDKSELPESYSFVNNSIIFRLEAGKTAKFCFDLSAPDIFSGIYGYPNEYFGVSIKSSDYFHGNFSVKLISSDGSFLESESLFGGQYIEPFFDKGLENEEYFEVSEEKSFESVCVEVYSSRDIETITVLPIKLVMSVGEHNYVYTEETPSTCTRLGSSGHSYCFNCKVAVSQGVAIAMLPHTKVIDKAIEPTCEKSGLTEGTHCEECKKVITEQQIIPASGHKYKWTTTKKATYFEKGKKEYKCTDCKKVINTAKINKKKLEVPKFSLVSGKKSFKIKYKKVHYATGFRIKYKVENKIKKINVDSKKSITKVIKNLKKGKTYKVWIRSYRQKNGKKAYSNWSTVKTVKSK